MSPLPKRAWGPGVYAIRNRVNNKIYVGSSCSIRRRIWEHKHALEDGCHHNKHLQYSWLKYGPDNFSFRVLEYCQTCELVEREQVWINFYHSYDRSLGYNLSPTAGSTLGVKLSPETCAKISASRKGIGVGRKDSPETRRKKSLALRGNKNGLGRQFKPTEQMNLARVVRMEGQRWGRLTVLEYVGSRPHALWRCHCDCGREIIAYGNNIRKGNTKSCGCLLTDVLVARNQDSAGRRTYRHYGS